VEHPSDFDETYAGDPVLGTFLLVYVGGFGVSLATLGWRSETFARRVARTEPSRSWLRRGLRTTAAGSAVAFGYCIGKAVLVIGSWLGGRPVAFSQAAVACACAGALTITAGFTMPSWGPRMSAVRQWWRRAGSYLRLYRLWRLLYDAVPDIALQPPASRLADLALLRDLNYQLYRRVVEIGDGRLALAPYTDGDADQLEPLAAKAGVTVDAMAEAARVRRAAAAVVEARRSGRTLTAGPPVPVRDPGTDLQEKVAWLEQIARALPYTRGGR
jgi:hypothetical protein